MRTNLIRGRYGLLLGVMLLATFAPPARPSAAGGISARPASEPFAPTAGGPIYVLSRPEGEGLNKTFADHLIQSAWVEWKNALRMDPDRVETERDDGRHRLRCGRDAPCDDVRVKKPNSIEYVVDIDCSCRGRGMDDYLKLPHSQDPEVIPTYIADAIRTHDRDKHKQPCQ